MTKQIKPTYIGFVATSIDGRISISDKHPPDWTSKEDWHFFQKALSKMDAVVVGRNTYQAVADRLRKRQTYVLSRRLQILVRRGTVTFVNPEKVDLSELLIGYRKIAVLGGGSVYQSMLEKDLLDEIFVTIEPMVFGYGKTMFENGGEIKQFVLCSVEQLNAQGTLLLHYKLKQS